MQGQQSTNKLNYVLNKRAIVLFIIIITMVLLFAGQVNQYRDLNKQWNFNIEDLKVATRDKCSQFFIIQKNPYLLSNVSEIKTIKIIKSSDVIQWASTSHSDKQLNQIFDANRKTCAIVNDYNIDSKIFNYTKVRYLIFRNIIQIEKNYQNELIQGNIRVEKQNINGIQILIVELLKTMTASSQGFFNGGRISEIQIHHINNGYLKDLLIKFYSIEKPDAIIDFGCGTCYYVKQLRAAGFKAVGYDGNPETKQITGNVGEVLNLAQPQNLGQVDWVQSFQVGQHIPFDKIKIFVKNLASHARKGLFISWGIRGQAGFAHISTRDNIEIIQMLKQYGFQIDVQATLAMRDHQQLYYFRQSIMVFRKKNQ